MRWDMLKLETNYCFTQGSKIKFTSICLFLKENSRATKMQRMLSVQTRIIFHKKLKRFTNLCVMLEKQILSVSSQF